MKTQNSTANTKFWMTLAIMFGIINQSRTPYDGYAELVIREPIAEVFEAIINEI